MKTKTIVEQRVKADYECLLSYADNYKELIELITILKPMLYKTSKGKLNISIGKSINNDTFISYLTAATKEFNVKLSQYKNEPQIVFESKIEHTTMATINLAAVRQLRVESNHIAFTYENGFDYYINIVT